MPNPTPAQLRRAALLALVWCAGDCAFEYALVEEATKALGAMGIDYDRPDTARVYLEAAQRELKAMEEGGERG